MSPSTKDKILETALELIAEKGLADTSLREITKKAGVNLAAIHYHFGSKDELLRALMQRVMRPLTEARLTLLDDAEARAGDAPVPLEELIEIFVGPPLRMGWGCERARMCTLRFHGRMLSEPSDIVNEIFREEILETAERFVAAFRRAAPELNPQELIWRMWFSIGAMAHTMGKAYLLEQLGPMKIPQPDVETLIKLMSRFLLAGWREDPTLPTTPKDEEEQA